MAVAQPGLRELHAHSCRVVAGGGSQTLTASRFIGYPGTSQLPDDVDAVARKLRVNVVQCLEMADLQRQNARQFCCERIAFMIASGSSSIQSLPVWRFRSTSQILTTLTERPASEADNLREACFEILASMRRSIQTMTLVSRSNPPGVVRRSPSSLPSVHRNRRQSSRAMHHRATETSQALDA